LPRGLCPRRPAFHARQRGAVRSKASSPPSTAKTQPDGRCATRRPLGIGSRPSQSSHTTAGYGGSPRRIPVIIDPPCAAACHDVWRDAQVQAGERRHGMATRDHPTRRSPADRQWQLGRRGSVLRIWWGDALPLLGSAGHARGSSASTAASADRSRRTRTVPTPSKTPPSTWPLTQILCRAKPSNRAVRQVLTRLPLSSEIQSIRPCPPSFICRGVQGLCKYCD
jgi:hypothetical protein